MKWILKQANDELQTWELTSNKPFTELKYNQHAHSFRLHSGEKRLFFLEKTGFVQTKLLLKTEYSIVIGEIHFFKNYHSGVAIIEDHKYHYSFKESSLNLQSFKDDETFSIEIDNALTQDQFSIAAIIFSSCRILQSKFQNEEMLLAQ